MADTKPFIPGVMQRSKRCLTVLSGNGNTISSTERIRAMISVNELCKRTGVTRKTLYYYDKIGLLKPAHRIGSQQAKMYGEEEEKRLLMILEYQKAGLSLNEIKGMLEGERDVQIRILIEAVNRLEAEESRFRQLKEAANTLLRSYNE